MANWLHDTLEDTGVSINTFIIQVAAAIGTHHPTSRHAQPARTARLVNGWLNGAPINYQHQAAVADVLNIDTVDVVVAGRPKPTTQQRTHAAGQPATSPAPRQRGRSSGGDSAQRAVLVAQRRARRAAFSAWLTRVSNEQGVPLNTWPADWLKGSVPRLTRLPWVADTLGLPLGDVLEAAGRPPHAQLRERFRVDPNGSLPALLEQWHTDTGITGVQAAELAHMPATSWPRYRTGTEIPSITRIVQIAHVTGIDAVTIAQACATAPGAPTALVDDVRRAGTGVPALARLWLVRHRATISDLAVATGLTLGQAKTLVNGGAAAPALAAFARLLNVSATDVLHIAGHDVDTAELVGSAFDDAAAATTPVATFAEQVARARHLLGWSQGHTAAHLGHSDHTSLARLEGGTRNPGFDTVVKISDVLHLPLADALRGAGLVPCVPARAA
jgi:hypothetical protein